MTNPANRTVLITGAGGGFGIEMVRQFRAAGAKLLLTDVSDAALAHAIDDAGSDLAGCLATDLATTEGCDALIELCASNGAPDILINNAGIAVAGHADRVPRERWETLMQLNLMAPMRLCSLLIPGMIERGGGHIVNISSVAGWIGAQGLSSYCASKFGLRGYGDSLAYELDGTGVRVTTVFPCFSRTPILDSPQFGYDEPREVPEYLVSEPKDVVRRIVRGVRRNRRYVYPDRYARLVQYITRFTPWALPHIDRRLDAQSIAEVNPSD
ncbi:MAG: SDR family oxidoreductase [Woeseiaceae bacterium]|nr:SDR family oxidoreductase [Woeseiaceae bacterium]